MIRVIPTAVVVEVRWKIFRFW